MRLKTTSEDKPTQQVETTKTKRRVLSLALKAVLERGFLTADGDRENRAIEKVLLLWTESIFMSTPCCEQKQADRERKWQILPDCGMVKDSPPLVWIDKVVARRVRITLTPFSPFYPVTESSIAGKLSTDFQSSQRPWVMRLTSVTYLTSGGNCCKLTVLGGLTRRLSGEALLCPQACQFKTYAARDPCCFLKFLFLHDTLSRERTSMGSLE